MRLYTVLLYFCETALYVSDDALIHHQEHTQTVITTSDTGGGVRTQTSSDSFTTGDSKTYGSTSARCCNYSLSVLLMMDEGIIQTCRAGLQKYNKTVYSHILLDNY